jgi:hypothetical protein
MLNLETQYYKGIPIRLIKRGYCNYNAKRFTLNSTNQNIWIPNCYLEKDGTLKEGVNIDFIFKKAYIQRKFEYAHIDNVNPLLW